MLAPSDDIFEAAHIAFPEILMCEHLENGTRESYAKHEFASGCLKAFGLFTPTIILNDAQILEHSGLVRMLLEERRIDPNPLSDYLRSLSPSGLGPVVLMTEPADGDALEPVSLRDVLLWKLQQDEYASVRPLRPRREPIECGSHNQNEGLRADLREQRSAERVLRVFAHYSNVGYDEFDSLLGFLDAIFARDPIGRRAYTNVNPDLKQYVQGVVEVHPGLKAKQREAMTERLLEAGPMSQTAMHALFKEDGDDVARTVINEASSKRFLDQFDWAAKRPVRTGRHVLRGPPGGDQERKPSFPVMLQEAVRDAVADGPSGEGRIILERMTFRQLMEIREETYETMLRLPAAYACCGAQSASALEAHVNAVVAAARERGLVDDGRWKIALVTGGTFGSQLVGRLLDGLFPELGPWATVIGGTAGAAIAYGGFIMRPPDRQIEEDARRIVRGMED